jgi:hypothetical protein
MATHKGWPLGDKADGYIAVGFCGAYMYTTNEHYRSLDCDATMVWSSSRKYSLRYEASHSPIN